MDRTSPRAIADLGLPPARLAAIALGIGALAFAALSTARADGAGLLLWPGSALLLVALLLHRPRDVLKLAGAGLLALLAAQLLSGTPPVRGGFLALTDSLAALATYAVLRRPSGRLLDLTRPSELQRFGLVGGVLAPLGAGLLAALAPWLLDGQALLPAWEQAAMAQGLGMVVVVPLAFSLLRASGLPVPMRRLGMPEIGTLLLVALLAGGVFLGDGLLPAFLLFAPLLLVGWRLGMPGAAAGLGLTSAIALLALWHGHTPFPGAGLGAEGTRALQFFLLFLAAPSLAMAAIFTSRQRLQKALRESEAESHRQAALLKVVMTEMEQGLAAFDGTGRLIAANRRYQELLRLPAALAVPGTRFLTITRALAAAGEFGPGDPDNMAQARLRGALDGAPRHFTRSTADGRMLEVMRRPLPGGGFVNTYTDVTERVLREKRLEESEASFRLLAENSGDVVTRLGLDGVRRYVSPAAQRVLHWPPEKLLGKNVRQFVHAEDRSWVASAMASLLSGEVDETTITYRFLRPDGSHAWVESHARLIRDAHTGEPSECIATLRDATDRKAAEEQFLGTFEQMEAMALTDALTGLANRRRFDDSLLREWRRAAREGTALSLVLVDADRFKAYNDQYGHAAGDTCLAQLAVALEGAARRPGDLAARFGGEEFAMLLPSTDPRGAHEVAERVRQAVESASIEHQGNLPWGVVTISAGIATVWPRPDQDIALAALLRAADAALYDAKHQGRNQVRQAPALLHAA